MNAIGYLLGLILLAIALQADSKRNEIKKHKEYVQWYKQNNLDYDINKIHQFSTCAYDNLKQSYILKTYDDRETDYNEIINNLNKGDYYIPLPEYTINNDGIYNIKYSHMIQI